MRRGICSFDDGTRRKLGEVEGVVLELGATEVEEQGVGYAGKRERAKKFDGETVIGLAVMLGDLRAEQERRESAGSGSVCLCCILPPEDVKRYILLKNGVRYLVMLSETSRGKEIPRGCFFVNSQDDYVFEITEFYVQDRYRRKGLGKKMFATFLSRFRKDRGNRGARIALSVALGNDAAEAFYRQLGFVEIAKVVEMAFESV